MIKRSILLGTAMLTVAGEALAQQLVQSDGFEAQTAADMAAPITQSDRDSLTLEASDFIPGARITRRTISSAGSSFVYVADDGLPFDRSRGCGDAQIGGFAFGSSGLVNLTVETLADTFTGSIELSSATEFQGSNLRFDSRWALRFPSGECLFEKNLASVASVGSASATYGFSLVQPALLRITYTQALSGNSNVGGYLPANANSIIANGRMSVSSRSTGMRLFDVSNQEYRDAFRARSGKVGRTEFALTSLIFLDPGAYSINSSAGGALNGGAMEAGGVVNGTARATTRYSISRPKAAILYTNGVGTNRRDAEADMNLLCERVHGSTNCAQQVYVLNFNETQGLVRDFIEANTQLNGTQGLFGALNAFGKTVLGGASNQDFSLEVFREVTRTNVARAAEDVREELTPLLRVADRVVLVGYSQGNLFHNALFTEATPLETAKVRVVAIATPANNVIGRTYTTTDKSAPYITDFADIIQTVPEALKYNVDNRFGSNRSIQGHSISKNYLQPDSETLERIKTSINTSLEL